MLRSLAIGATVLAAATATPASSATLYSNPSLTGGAVASPGAAGFSAGSPVGQPGALSFNLDGYLSLDGDSNCCTDVFTLNVNGIGVLSLSYDLGGGGGNVVYTNLNGATITGGTFGFFQGGQLQISLPVALLAGANSFNFAYAGGPQGIGDEGWGVSNVLLTADIAGGVPEPAGWALLIGGFALAGAALRRRKGMAAAIA